MTFNVQRKRPQYSRQVQGTVADPDEPRSSVSFETAGQRWADESAEERPATVNWSAHGDVSPDEARRYAKQIVLAAEEAEMAPREFEPDDAVTFTDLAADRRARIVDYDTPGDFVSVEDFVPGEYEETKRTSGYSLTDATEIGLRRLTREEISAEEAETRAAIAAKEAKS